MGSIRVPGEARPPDPRPRPRDSGEATYRAMREARCPSCNGTGHPHPGGLSHGTLYCPTCRALFSFGPWLRRDTLAAEERDLRANPPSRRGRR